MTFEIWKTSDYNELPCENAKLVKDEITQFYHNSFEIFMSISYYMQHFNSEIEYAEVEVKDNKKSSKNKTNGGYSQKIILKSKKKKYIIKDTDNFVLKKKKESSKNHSSGFDEDNCAYR